MQDNVKNDATAKESYDSRRKERKWIRGITLIALIITVIVLLILAGVALNFVIGENGILKHAKVAEEKTNKQTATEKMNLKITTAQMNKYVEEQRMPTLQEFADELCEDNEIQYVQLQSKKVANLSKIEIGTANSIFTKLKEYPYEFEINSSLQLASIDGIKVANTQNNKGVLRISLTDEEKRALTSEKASQIQIEEGYYTGLDVKDVYDAGRLNNVQESYLECTVIDRKISQSAGTSIEYEKGEFKSFIIIAGTCYNSARDLTAYSTIDATNATCEELTYSVFGSGITSGTELARVYIVKPTSDKFTISFTTNTDIYGICGFKENITPTVIENKVTSSSVSNQTTTINHGNYDYFLVGVARWNGGGYSDQRTHAKLMCEKHAFSEAMQVSYPNLDLTGNDHIFQRLYIIKSNNYSNNVKLQWGANTDLYWVIGINL